MHRESTLCIFQSKCLFSYLSFISCLSSDLPFFLYANYVAGMESHVLPRARCHPA